MLLELKVSHFAIIDKLSVHFLRPGLNILTGETGAGKSVLLRSLSLLMGGKAATDVIRTGSEQAEIEGAFDVSARPDVKKVLNEFDLKPDEEILIVRRIINKNGKHRVYINGHLSTLGILEQLVPLLVEITGQHEHHSLIKPLAQLDLLDNFGGTLLLREKYFDKREAKKTLERQLAELKISVQGREQRMDFLKFQISEIAAFDPQEGDEERLATAYQRAKHSAKLLQFAQNAENFIFGDEDGMQARLSLILKEGENLLAIDSSLLPMLENLKSIFSISEDISYSLSDYRKKNSSGNSGGGNNGETGESSDSLDSIAERLSDFKKLQRKYGINISSIIEFRDKAQSEFDLLESSEENIALLDGEIQQLNSELWTMAENLSKLRKKASTKMVLGVNKELKELNMKGAELSVDIAKAEQLQATGCDDVTFMIKAAPLEPARALSRVASGGELSRIMLALKQVVAMSDLPMTYLFDEVDTGVSGPTAEKVGRKLKSIAGAHQVISITHLPQVASFADAHFLISKEVQKGFVKSDVQELSTKERIQELGRLISGAKITATSLAHAKQMLESCRLDKKIISR